MLPNKKNKRTNEKISPFSINKAGWICWVDLPPKDSNFQFQITKTKL